MDFKVVLDTNVLVAGLRSSRGASFQLLNQIGRGRFDIVVSVALVLEYESTLKRQTAELGLDAGEVDDVLDYLCSVAQHQAVFFLWRPALPDPGDDMVLELAVAGHCSHIVTHNVKDFTGIADFGLQVTTPREFLGLLERSP